MDKALVDVHRITEKEELINVLKAFKDYPFLQGATDDSKIDAYAQKQIDNGNVIVEYHGDKPVGFICFYTNDSINKIAFVSLLALSDELGFLKGKTMIRILKEAILIAQADGCETIKLEVDKDNKAARKLYEHFQFEYSGEETEHTLYMVSSLDSFDRLIGK